MKRTLFLLLLAILFFSCKNEDDLAPGNKNDNGHWIGHPVKISASSGNSTKTSLIGFETHWDKGDKIGVFSPQAHSQSQGDENVINVPFEALTSGLASEMDGLIYWGTGEHNFYAYYPYVPGNAEMKYSQLPIAISPLQTQQKGNDNSHVGNVDFMIATPLTDISAGDKDEPAMIDFQFNHVFSMLEFRVVSEKKGKLHQISMYVPDESYKIAFPEGTIDLSQSTPEEAKPYVINTEASSRYVKVDLRTPAQLTDEYDTTEKIWMMINAVNLNDCPIVIGLHYEINNKDAYYHITNGTNFERGKKYVVELDADDFKVGDAEEIVFNRTELLTHEVEYTGLTHAQLKFSVVHPGDPIYRETGICYSLSPFPTIEDMCMEALPDTPVLIEELQPYTRYYARSYAKDGFGIVYGNEISFETIENQILHIHIETPGTLENSFGIDKNNIITLKVTGNIDAGDFKVLNKLPNLTNLDISGVNIKSTESELTDLIPAGAFSGNKVLKEINLPLSAKAIGNRAFTQSTTLEKVVFPESLISIGNNTFSNCTGFTGDLILPDQLVSIGDSAFLGCHVSDGSLIIGENVQQIGGLAFSDCSGLNGHLVIPPTVKQIDRDAFRNCKNITGLTLSEGLTHIGIHAFFNCTNLKGTVVIPSTVEEIGGSAFSKCENITGLILQEGVTNIEDSAFEDCISLTGDLVIPSTVKNIGRDAFRNCKSVTGLTLQEGLMKIGTLAFSYCTGLTGDLVIPSTVKRINEKTFMYCENLTGLTLQEGLMKIGNYAFAYCSALTGTLVIPSTVRQIEQRAFDRCINLSGLVLQEGLKEIGEYAFLMCKITGDVKIPSTIKKIEPGIFSSCNLTGLSLPEGLEEIGDYAFHNCDIIGDLIIPSTVKRIGESAFNNCSEVTSLSLPDGLLEIRKNTFNNFWSLTGHLTIPSTVQRIEEGAFRGCTRITGLTLPDGLLEIGENAFSSCYALTGHLTIPANIKYIGKETFMYGEKLTGLSLPEGLLTIGENSFYNCKDLTGDLTIPSSVQEIGRRAFYNVKKIDAIFVSWPVPISYNDDMFDSSRKIYVPKAYLSIYEQTPHGRTITYMVIKLCFTI